MVLTGAIVDELGLPDVFSGRTIFRAGPGCVYCNQIGYSDAGIIEVLPITDEVTE